MQNFPQILQRKRVGYTGEEISRPQTLLEIIPGLPPAGAVGIVDPLTLATGDVREALIDPRLVLLPEAERVGVRPARVHATDEEWNKIGPELLQRGVVVEIAREDAPIVDGQPVLFGAFGVEKRGTPIPPATRVLRLIVNAIPSNRQQTAIKGDIEQMPVGGEWLHIALQSDEIVFWSSDDIRVAFTSFRYARVAKVDDFIQADSGRHARRQGGSAGEQRSVESWRKRTSTPLSLTARA